VNNKLKTAYAASALMLIAIGANVHAASTGTITFNGELTATTCDVSVNGSGPSATVKLPTMAVTQLDAAGKTGGTTKFNMALSNCAGTLTTASAFFEAGPTVDLTSGRLNSSGTASNVQLELLDGSSSTLAPINVGDSAQVNDTTYVDVSGGTANLPYAVRYYATDATGAGTVVSNVVYSIQYK